MRPCGYRAENQRYTRRPSKPNAHPSHMPRRMHTGSLRRSIDFATQITTTVGDSSKVEKFRGLRWSVPIFVRVEQQSEKQTRIGHWRQPGHRCGHCQTACQRRGQCRFYLFEFPGCGSLARIFVDWPGVKIGVAAFRLSANPKHCNVEKQTRNCMSKNHQDHNSTVVGGSK